MKFFKFAMLASVFGLVMNSCTLYEDGPLLSILSKKDRIANVWIADEVIESDGDVVTDSYNSWTWTFTEDGEASIASAVLGIPITLNGTWNLLDNGAIFQTIMDLGVGTEIDEYEILRLTADEFWVLAEDGTEFRLKTK